MSSGQLYECTNYYHIQIALLCYHVCISIKVVSTTHSPDWSPKIIFKATNFKAWKTEQGKPKKFENDYRHGLSRERRPPLSTIKTLSSKKETVLLKYTFNFNKSLTSTKTLKGNIDMENCTPPRDFQCKRTRVGSLAHQ